MSKLLCLHGHGTSASIFKSQTCMFMGLNTRWPRVFNWPSSVMIEFGYGGGHDIPRSTEVLNEIVWLIKDVMKMIGFPVEKSARNSVALKQLSGFKVEYATLSVDKLQLN